MGENISFSLTSVFIWIRMDDLMVDFQLLHHSCRFDIRCQQPWSLAQGWFDVVIVLEIDTTH